MYYKYCYLRIIYIYKTINYEININYRTARYDNEEDTSLEKNSLEEVSPIALLKLQLNPTTGKRVFSDEELNVYRKPTNKNNEGAGGGTGSKSNSRRGSMSMNGRDTASISSRRGSVVSDGNESIKTDNGISETPNDGFTIQHYERPRIIRLVLVSNIKRKFSRDLTR